jgi:hypothetical protein
LSQFDSLEREIEEEIEEMIEVESTLSGVEEEHEITEDNNILSIQMT